MTPVKSVRSYPTQPVRTHANTGSPAFSTRDILTVVFKHKGKILCFFLLGLLLSPVIYRMKPVVYRATAVLMATQGREYVRPSIGAGDQSAIRLGLEQILGTEMAIMKSNDVMDMVIDRVGMETILPGVSPQMASDGNLRDIARSILEAGLLVETGKASNIIRVSYTHPVPKTTAYLANGIVEAYLEKRIQILNNNRPKQVIENKVEEYRNRLHAAENKLEAFRQQNRVFSLDEQKRALIQQRSSLDNAIRDAQTQSKELQQKLSSLETQTRNIPQTLPDESGVKNQNDAENQLLSLQRKEQELLSKYREDTPFVQSVRNEIQLVQAFIARQNQHTNGRMANDLHQTLEKDIITARADLSSLNVRIVELKSQLQELDRETQTIDLLEKSYRELQRDMTSTEKAYQMYAQKLEDSSISDELDQKSMGSISIIEKAEVPLGPEGKKKGLLFFLAAGMLMGLGAGLGLAFFLEAFRESMGTPEKAEKLLELPVLSTFSYQK